MTDLTDRRVQPEAAVSVEVAPYDFMPTADAGGKAS